MNQSTTQKQKENNIVTKEASVIRKFRITEADDAIEFLSVWEHINNVFSEGELIKDSTVVNFATVQNERERRVERRIEYYNLEVVLLSRTINKQ